MKKCVRDGCENHFSLSGRGGNNNKKYCSLDCKREVRHLLYKTNPDFKNRNYQKSREWIHRHWDQALKQARKDRLKKHYGLTLQQYEDILKSQNGVCAICHAPPKKFSLPVDHDHKTGKIRSLLCIPCNVLLGRAKDNPDFFLRYIEYLRKHSDQSAIEKTLSIV